MASWVYLFLGSLFFYLGMYICFYYHSNLLPWLCSIFNSNSGILLAFIFLLSMALPIWGLLWFPMNFRYILFGLVKSILVNLRGLQWIGRSVSMSMENLVFYNIFLQCLKDLPLKSSMSLVRFLPRYFTLLKLLWMRSVFWISLSSS